MSREIYSSSGVCQGCPLSPFLFNLMINILIEVSLLSPGHTDVDLITGEFLLDLEYADEIVLLSEDADKMQSLLNTSSGNLRMFGMRFSPPKCKLLLQDWSSAVPQLTNAQKSPLFCSMAVKHGH
ncbi:unnamed protein product [Heterobilharzia americana]|nr:unnamed protein product [Heterobilharzia americana]CAH8467471.1 unnamed protein product [Heterobilharzia americana]